MAQVLGLVPDLWLSRSWTTRARRPGEAASAYEFVDRRTFSERVEQGGFLEWASVLGQLYGTPVPAPPPGADVLLEIDVQGGAQVLRRSPGAVMILVLAPSRQVQADRLRGRGDSERQVQRRLALGEEEERQGRELAGHVVVNDDLGRAVAEVAGIIESHRSRAQAAP